MGAGSSAVVQEREKVMDGDVFRRPRRIGGAENRGGRGLPRFRRSVRRLEPGGEPLNKFHAAKPAFAGIRGERVGAGIYFRARGVHRLRWWRVRRLRQWCGDAVAEQLVTQVAAREVALRRESRRWRLQRQPCPDGKGSAEGRRELRGR